MSSKEEAIRKIENLTKEQSDAFLTYLETHPELLQNEQPDPHSFG